MLRFSSQPPLRVMNPGESEEARRRGVARAIESYSDEQPTKCWAKSCAVPGIWAADDTHVLHIVFRCSFKEVSVH
eukprot:2431650-Amphidinium_carterae.1